MITPRACLLLAGLVALSMGPGCKDEPTPPAPTAEAGPRAGKAGVEAGPDATPAAAEAPEVAKKKAAEANTITPPAVAPAEAAPRPNARAALHPMTLAGFHDEVVAVVGISSPRELVAGVTSWVSRIETSVVLPPEPLASGLELARMTLGVQDLTWLAVDQPWRIVLPNPRQWTEGFIAIVPLTSEATHASATAAMGTALKPAEGHLGRIVLPDRTLWVDAAPGHLVVSSHADLFTTLKGSLTASVLAWKPTYPLVIETSATNLRRVYEGELAVSRRMAQAILERMGKSRSNPLKGRAAHALVDTAISFVDGLERASVALIPDAETTRLAVAFTGAKGSDLRAITDALKPTELPVSRAIPASAYVALARDVPPGMAAVSEADLAAVFAGFELSEADLAHIAAQLTTVNASQSGAGALWLRRDGTLPFGVGAITEATDGHAIRKAVLTIGETLYKRVVGRFKSALGSDGSAVPLDDFGQAVEMANTMGSALGASLKVVDEARGAAHLSALVLTVDWDGLGLAVAEPTLHQLGKALLGNRTAIAIASTPQRFTVALGPTGDQRALALAGGAYGAGLAAIEARAPGTHLAAALRPGPMLMALAAMPALAQHRKAFGEIPSEAAITVDLGVDAVGDHRALVMTADVPLPLLGALLTLE